MFYNFLVVVWRYEYLSLMEVNKIHALHHTTAFVAYGGDFRFVQSMIFKIKFLQVLQFYTDMSFRTTCKTVWKILKSFGHLQKLAWFTLYEYYISFYVYIRVHFSAILVQLVKSIDTIRYPVLILCRNCICGFLPCNILRQVETHKTTSGNSWYFLIH